MFKRGGVTEMKVFENSFHLYDGHVTITVDWNVILLLYEWWCWWVDERTLDMDVPVK